MQAYELKEYLSKNEDQVVRILEDLGMHHINTSHHKHISCGMPDGDNPSSTVVYKDNMKVRAYTRDLGNKENGSDIFILIMFVKGISFPKSVRYAHKLLGIKFTYYNEEMNENKIDLLSRFRKIKKKRDRAYDYDTHPEFILNKYDPLPHVDFIKDNILPKSYRKYDTRFDCFSQRIILTHRKWDTGEILGFFGRTTIPNWEELGLQKYIGIMPFDRGGNLYGLDINYEAIIKAGYVVVLESEKSIQQADSFGENATCAICCADVTREQRKILLSLNVDIIFAFDKGISLEHIDLTCKPFLNKRRIYYIYDNDNMLQDKESPTDNGVIIYEMLLSEKIEYTGEIKEI
jgi:DNA primase